MSLFYAVTAAGSCFSLGPRGTSVRWQWSWRLAAGFILPYVVNVRGLCIIVLNILKR